MQGKRMKNAQSQPSQPSMIVHMQKQQSKMMKAGEMQEDLGLLPETFIMPFGKQRPSWFSDFRKRLKLEVVRWRSRGRDLYLYISFWWAIRRPVSSFGLSKTAKDLHREMFANFATGNLAAMDTKLCPGILSSLQMRISQRPQNTSYLWKVHKYLTQPKLMSYRLFVLPDTVGWAKKDRHGMAQAVVRIHTLQSLQPRKRVHVQQDGKRIVKEVVVDARGNEQPLERMVESSDASVSKKETVEYVVLQQIYKRTQPQEWKVWGMTDEVTIGQIEEAEEGRKKMKKVKVAQKAEAVA